MANKRKVSAVGRRSLLRPARHRPCRHGRTPKTDAQVAIDHAGLSADDAISHGADATDLLDVDVDARAGFLRSERRTGSAGSNALSLFKPSRRRTRLTVAGETPTCSPLAAQPFDVLDDRLRRWPPQPMRPG
jgi:hypothetical protein